MPHIEFENEPLSNADRTVIQNSEPLAQRTFTPSLAVIARSAGVYHWTPEGRRLFDYSSGVLVSNLGHNPRRWYQRLGQYLGWTPDLFNCGGPAVAKGGAGTLTVAAKGEDADPPFDDFAAVAPLTAYNAVTRIEAAAVERLIASVQRARGGRRLNCVVWAASGSEAIHKSLYACLHRDERRDVILATRFGFHGKKGLATAVTGSEKDPDRDPRVRFISFPMGEVHDHAKADGREINWSLYDDELTRLANEFGPRLNCLITEPYLGGGGSYHPPAEYHQRLQRFCRRHDTMFLFDEVQANFGRTGSMYAFESYGVEPDFVVLGKGLGNGVPVAAVVGRGDVMGKLNHGDASDTWSANPLSCAAVLATLDEFEQSDVLERGRALTPLFFAGLDRLKETGLVANVRGEGVVFGVECAAAGKLTSRDVAVAIVRAAYLGDSSGDGIHFLGPLAGNVLRVSPPLVMSRSEALESLDLLYRIVSALSEELRGATAATAATTAVR
jgi:4-aminobutyrate aminotransferase-like enzyme